MHIWALYSLKGGVGKTAAAVNLAWEAAAAGQRVLLWDLDPQGAATWYLRADDHDELAAKKIVAGKTPLGRHVRHSAYARLDVLPGDYSFRHLDALLHELKGSKKRLADLAEPFSESYSLLILDCPPGIGSLAEAIMRAADTVLVPVVPTPLSLRALDQVRALAQRDRKKAGVVQPFFSLVDRRKRLHKQLVDTPPKAMQPRLAAWIGASTDVERMGEQRAPVAAFAPRSRAASQMHGLWQALL